MRHIFILVQLILKVAHLEDYMAFLDRIQLDEATEKSGMTWFNIVPAQKCCIFNCNFYFIWKMFCWKIKPKYAKQTF